MNRLKQLLRTYREPALYLFFGGLTTLVNFIGYYALSRLLAPVMGPVTALNTANFCAITLSILFAYVTNRRFVFQSKAAGRTAVLREMAAFFGCRLITMGLDMALMNLLVVALHMPDMIGKILVNILVIIANYILSKRIVFRKDGK